MPEGISPEHLMNNIMETLNDNISQQRSGSYYGEERSNIVSSQYSRLFGREKPVHHILGGGKSADVLLWRNKKISAGVLGGATIVWILFEWLNYHFLSLILFGLAFGLLAQFAWSNASGMLNRSRSEVPRLYLPEELFVNIAKTAGYQVNRTLGILQDIACQGTSKQLLYVIVGLIAAAMISSWCNFLTVLYIGFIGAHTLPVLYERYENQVDGFADGTLRQLRKQYQKLDSNVLRRIPTRKFGLKKYS